MSFEPKIFQSDEPAPRDSSLERKSLGEPALPLWDDAEQLALPADLAALAEQLRDDAIYVAQSHPADATPDERAAAWADVQKNSTTKSRFTRIGWWVSGAAAAAVIVAASCIGWALVERDEQRPAEVAAAATPSVVAEKPSNELVARIHPADAGRAPAMDVIVGSDEVPGPRVIRLPEDSPPRVIPAGAFLQDVSGPELDAMLELLVEQTDSGLSI